MIKKIRKALKDNTPVTMHLFENFLKLATPKQKDDLFLLLFNGLSTGRILSLGHAQRVETCRALVKLWAVEHPSEESLFLMAYDAMVKKDEHTAKRYATLGAELEKQNPSEFTLNQDLLTKLMPAPKLYLA